MVQVCTIMLAAYTRNSAVLSGLDALLHTDGERAALGYYVSTRLGPLVDALHQGELCTPCELRHFCGAAVHAWLCEV